MKKLLALVMMALMVFAAACSTEQPGSDTEKETKTKDFKIGLSISTLNNPFFVSLKDGAEEEAKAQGATLQVADAQDDAAKQASDIEDMIQKESRSHLDQPNGFSSSRCGCPNSKRCRHSSHHSRPER